MRSVLIEGLPGAFLKGRGVRSTESPPDNARGIGNFALSKPLLNRSDLPVS
jgi:hypothetical protein